MLILIRNLNVFAARFQLDADSLTEPLVVSRKGQL